MEGTKDDLLEHMKMFRGNIQKPGSENFTASEWNSHLRIHPVILLKQPFR